MFCKNSTALELGLNPNDPLMNKVPDISFALGGFDIMSEYKKQRLSVSIYVGNCHTEHLRFMRSSKTRRGFSEDNMA